MASTVDNHESFFSVDLLEIAKGFFLYSIWFNNVFINVKDIISKSGGMAT